MSVYMIVYATVTDPERFRRYVAAAGPAIARHGGRPVARGAPDVLEGEWHFQSATVIEWPDRAAANAFWHSGDYVSIRALREGAAVLQVVLVGD